MSNYQLLLIKYCFLQYQPVLLTVFFLALATQITVTLNVETILMPDCTCEMHLSS
jgi:hypothetical protein